MTDQTSLENSNKPPISQQQIKRWSFEHQQFDDRESNSSQNERVTPRIHLGKPKTTLDPIKRYSKFRQAKRMVAHRCNQAVNRIRTIEHFSIEQNYKQKRQKMLDRIHELHLMVEELDTLYNDRETHLSQLRQNYSRDYDELLSLWRLEQLAEQQFKMMRFLRRYGGWDPILISTPHGVNNDQPQWSYPELTQRYTERKAQIERERRSKKNSKSNERTVANNRKTLDDHVNIIEKRIEQECEIVERFEALAQKLVANGQADDIDQAREMLEDAKELARQELRATKP